MDTVSHKEANDNGDEDQCDRWSQLPIDMATKITNLLPLPNRIVFRMVCASWCDSIPPVNIPSPWLLHPGDGTKYREYTEYTDYFTFCSMPTKTIFQCTVPPGISGMCCVGSQDGWLFMFDLINLNLHVLNPLTGVRIDLPTLTPHPDFEPKYKTGKDGSRIFSGFSKHSCGTQTGRRSFTPVTYLSIVGYISKVVISSSPTKTNFMAMAICCLGKLAYTRAGDSNWRILKDNPSDTSNKYRASDVVFYDGKFWALLTDRRIVAFDLMGRRLPKVWEKLEDSENLGRRYLAISNEDLFVVLRDGNYQRCLNYDYRQAFHTGKVVVMQLKGSCWQDVKNLEGRSLFVGCNNSFFAEESPQLRGNCVFFTGMSADMGFFDMGKQCFEYIYPSNKELMWPRYRYIWFKPSLA